MRISGMRCLIRISLETIRTWYWHRASVIVKEEAVPGNPANRNILHENREFMVKKVKRRSDVALA